MNIINAPIGQNDCYKNNVNKADSRYTAFQKRGPLGLMLHSVGCSQPSAKVFADGWNVSGKEVAVHAVLQADGTVYQCMPWNYRGWHAGGDANNTHVGVEMTEPAQIKYTTGANFTCSDLEAAREQVRGTYKTAVDLFAYLCDLYDLDPMTAIISHAEGGRKGIASTHADPEHLWNGLGMGYTMDGFRRDVKAKLDGAEVSPNIPIHDDPETPVLTAADVQRMIDASLDKALGVYVETIKDIPHEAVKDVARTLLDMEAVDGGTTYAVNPDDIRLPYNILRAVVVAVRYADKRVYRILDAIKAAAEGS